MTKRDYKKVKAKLSEEIKRYGKTMENVVKSVPKPHSVFQSVIPYNGFKIILTSIIVPKEIEHFYYSRAIYGWWNFCAQKDKLDEWDKKMMKEHNQYSQYQEDDHHFCNDNQQEGNFFKDLHPNDMVEDLKQQINLYYRDSEIQIARSKMTKEDYEKIEIKAKAFLDGVIKDSNGLIKEFDHSEMQKSGFPFKMGKEGWLVQGKRHNYFVDKEGKAYYFEPKGKKNFQAICIMSKTSNKFLHVYDHTASRMLALLNDNKTKKDIPTID